MSETVTIHTDGACTGNPGPGGFAAIIQISSAETTTITGGDPATTNNRMELSAIIEAIRILNSMPAMHDCPITVRTDSQYIVNAFKEDWIDRWERNGWRTAKSKPVANQDLWRDLLQQIEHHSISWVWVKGHSGDAMNEKCDRLARAEAAYAPCTDRYWTSTGTPRSVDRHDPGTPAADAADATPEPAGKNPDAVAIAMMRAMPRILASSQSFDEFRTEMLQVMALHDAT